MGIRTRLLPPYLFLGILTLTACRKKYEHCDSATICVKNTGSTPIPYAWNSNAFADTLQPGQSTCTVIGEYNADPKNQAGEIVYFETNNATWAIKPTACRTEKEIDH
ncbi:MAG: hypothetical protein K0S33_3616 [Bacteroidetes bacterium]|jgi:hypothetical protein|nr:hypothetical protein [Bacteroidota bacterium]